MKYYYDAENNLQASLAAGEQLTQFWIEAGDNRYSHSGRLVGTFERHPLDLQETELLKFIDTLQPVEVRSVKTSTKGLRQNMCHYNARIMVDKADTDLVEGFLVLQLERGKPWYVAKKHAWNRMKNGGWIDFTREVDQQDNKRLLVESPLGPKVAKPASRNLEEYEAKFNARQHTAKLRLMSSR